MLRLICRLYRHRLAPLSMFIRGDITVYVQTCWCGKEGTAYMRRSPALDGAVTLGGVPVGYAQQERPE